MMALLHYYVTDSPTLKIGDKALCGHVYTDDGATAGKCPICVAVERSHGKKYALHTKRER
jgi:hypothetical protein